MAEKGFGVKEINLIGASGTPTIESPNNLNLNAVNVAISTNVSIGGTLTVSGSLSIGGTITYEDVTNVDSIGIITARSDIKVGSAITLTSAGAGFYAGIITASNFVKRDGTVLGGGSGITTAEVRANTLNVSGVSTFVGVTTFKDDIFLPDGKSIDLGNGSGIFSSIAGLEIMHSGNGFISNSGGVLNITSVSGDIRSYTSDNFSVFTNNSEQAILATKNGSVALYHDGGNKKLETNSSGVTITGTLGATAVTGDGSGLTGIAVTEAPVTDYTITADSGSNYYFHGGGVDETDGNPDLYLIRGQKYRFNNTTGSGHPFKFRTKNINVGGQTYSDGITGDDEGVQFFTVPVNAPASLVYQCEIHAGMVGNIHIRGADGDGIANTGSVGVQTANITDPNLVGAASSLVGLYIGDGSLLFSDQLARVGGYYITTGVNALNAGPVTLNSEMKLDGTWTIV